MKTNVPQSPDRSADSGCGWPGSQPTGRVWLAVLQVGGATYLPGDEVDDQEVLWYVDAAGRIVESRRPPRVFVPQSAAGFYMGPVDGFGSHPAGPASGPGVVGASGPGVTPCGDS